MVLRWKMFINLGLLRVDFSVIFSLLCLAIGLVQCRSSSPSSCGPSDGWFPYVFNGTRKCYRIEDDVRVTSLREAQNYCQSIGGTIGRIENVPTKHYLVSRFTKHMEETPEINMHYAYWTGLRLKEIEHSPSLVDTLDDFESAQDWEPYHNHTGDCIIIINYSLQVPPYKIGQWEQVSCDKADHPYGIICQKPLVDDTIKTVDQMLEPCPDRPRYVRFQDSCFRFFDDKPQVNWTAAQDFCRAQGGLLAGGAFDPPKKAFIQFLMSLYPTKQTWRNIIVMNKCYWISYNSSFVTHCDRVNNFMCEVSMTQDSYRNCTVRLSEEWDELIAEKHEHPLGHTMVILMIIMSVTLNLFFVYVYILRDKIPKFGIAYNHLTAHENA